MKMAYNTKLLFNKYIDSLDTDPNVWEHINRDSRRLFELAEMDNDGNGEQMKEVMFKVIEIFEILSK